MECGDGLQDLIPEAGFVRQDWDALQTQQEAGEDEPVDHFSLITRAVLATSFQDQAQRGKAT